MSTETEQVNQALLNACSHGDMTTVRRLLTDIEFKHLVDIHYVDKLEQNALCNACWHGHLDIVKYLLTSEELTEHSQIDFQNKQGEFALFLAAKKGHLHIVQYLLQCQDFANHSHIDLVDNGGKNALIIAAHHGHLAVVQFLLTFSKEPLFYIHYQDSNGYDALHHAAFMGKLEVVEYLLTSEDLHEKADIESQCEVLQTPLMMACATNHLEVVRFLLTDERLEKHSNIFAKDVYGDEVIYFAMDNNIDVFDYLLMSEELDIRPEINSHYIIDACLRQKTRVLDYLIIEKNVAIDEKTHNTLKENQDKFHYQYALKLIQARQSYQRLNHQLNDKVIKQRKKI